MSWIAFTVSRSPYTGTGGIWGIDPVITDCRVCPGKRDPRNRTHSPGFCQSINLAHRIPSSGKLFAFHSINLRAGFQRVGCPATAVGSYSPGLRQLRMKCNEPGRECQAKWGLVHHRLAHLQFARRLTMVGDREAVRCAGNRKAVVCSWMGREEAPRFPATEVKGDQLKKGYPGRRFRRHPQADKLLRLINKPK